MTNRICELTVSMSGRRLWPNVLMTALLVAACGRTASHPQGTTAPDDAGAEYRALYDAGFKRIIAALPGNAKESDLWPLDALTRFRTERVAWARLEGTRYYALERGYGNGGWLVIVPPDSEILDKMPTTMEMDPSPTHAVVLIKQERVSELWAGLFLVHEVSHLADRCAGVQPPDATRRQHLEGELRAYALEIMAADVVSAGAFQANLDALLDDWQVDSLTAVAQRASHMEPQEMTILSAAIRGGEPQSAAEIGMRAGLFAAAAVLRFGERAHANNDAVEDALDELLKSQPHAVGVKKDCRAPGSREDARSGIVRAHERRV